MSHEWSVGAWGIRVTLARPSDAIGLTLVLVSVPKERSPVVSLTDGYHILVRSLCLRVCMVPCLQ